MLDVPAEQLDEALDEIDRLRRVNAELVGMLQECQLQIEYLDEKSGPHSTTVAVLARIENALRSAGGAP